MNSLQLFAHVLRVASWAGLVRTMETGATELIQAEADALTQQMPGVWALRKGGVWTLRENDLWNIPAGLAGSKFEMEYSGQYGFQRTHKLRGLVIGLTGQVFGMRTLSDQKQEGYQLHGRVSVGGKKYGAFTSTRLFERPDGSLCDVEVLILCRGW